MSLSRRNFSKLIGSAVLADIFFTALPAVGKALAGANDAGSPLTAKSLSEVSAMIHSGTVTSKQLVQALLDRIALYNPKINCYVTVTAKEAFAAAEQMDAEAAAGKFRGPLHGIPISLKDNIDTAGIRTTAASPMFKDRIPDEDAEVVRRLKEAGAVIIGKLNLHEFALGCTGDVSYFGPTRNPWNLAHVTGGSSAGSGAAPAAEMAFGALGT
ncbi:MAG TPA: amidase, partial [Steroidobacteraceae bacterium]|nr:amidase [Steroidobacteraceae bacterium]